MINEKVTTDGKTIMDILTEFYKNHKDDRDVIDKLIQVFDLMGGPGSAFLADNAQLINSLIGARQKTTKDLLDMLNIVQRFQANEMNSDESALEQVKDFMQGFEDEDDDVEDLMSTIEKDNSGNKEVEDAIKLVRGKNEAA